MLTADKVKVRPPLVGAGEAAIGGVPLELFRLAAAAMTTPFLLFFPSFDPFVVDEVVPLEATIVAEGPPKASASEGADSKDSFAAATAAWFVTTDEEVVADVAEEDEVAAMLLVLTALIVVAEAFIACCCCCCCCCCEVITAIPLVLLLLF